MKLSKEEVISFGEFQSLLKVALITINEKSCIMHMNAYATKLLGITDDKHFLGKSIIKVLEKAHYPPFINHKGEIANGVILINDYFQKWRKSTVIVENEECSLLIGHNIGRQKKIYQTFLTAFENNNTLLNRDKLYLNNIIENLPALIYWKDNNCIYQGCNKGVAELLNLRHPSEIIGKTDYDFGWSSDRIKNLQSVDLSIIQKGISNVSEDAIPVKGIIKIHITSKTPLRDQSGKIIGILGISTDISERKKMEEDLKRAKEAAEAASRAKTAFIANMSHDIRTPLSGVVGISELLENTLENPTEKEEAHLLHDSGEELLSMLNDILDDVQASDLSEFDLREESFDLRQCIKEIIHLELPTIRLKNLDFQIDIDKAIPTYIISDRTKIHRILLNLLGNAIKFTPNDKSIRIEIKCLAKAKKRIQIQFAVSDTGIGIPLELQDKVFERFFRGTPSYKGLYAGHGIGLHIAQTYVKLLGGDIMFASQEGVGTKFYFDLQCKVGSKLRPESLNPLLPSHKPAKTKRVKLPIKKSKSPLTTNATTDAPHLLLVEDNTTSLLIAESIASKAGCQFTSAINGEQALEIAKSIEFDLIITDIGLPGISGHEFTRRIRDFEFNHHKNPTPIVGLSAQAKETTKAECQQCGMNDVFIKPITLPIMQSILNQFVSPKKRATLSKNNIDKQSKTDHLGADLPDIEAELIELDNFPLLDIKSVIGCVKDENLVRNLLESMMNKEIPNGIAEIETAFAENNWDAIEKIAHKMKERAAHCGTLRLKYACQYIERYIKAGHTAALRRLYYQLIRVSYESIEAIQQFIQN